MFVSVQDSELVGCASLLVVFEREDGVVALHLPIGPLKKPSLVWNQY